MRQGGERRWLGSWQNETRELYGRHSKVMHRPRAARRKGNNKKEGDVQSPGVEERFKTKRDVFSLRLK